jgi:ABC-type multidrug transport system fused ATPase/permease subunit
MTLTSLRKAWALLDRHERRMAVKVLAMMIVGAFSSAAMVGSAFPFLSVLSDPSIIGRLPILGWTYEFGGFSSDYHFLVFLGFAAIGVIIISNGILILQTWVVAHYTEMRIHAISRRLLAHYLAQPYDFFLGRHSADMSSSILTEAEKVVQQFLRPLADLFSSMMTVLAVLATLLLVDPVVASVTIGAFSLIYGGVALVSRKFVKSMGALRVTTNERRYRIASEVLGGVKDVKLLGREGAYLERFSESSADMARANIWIGLLVQAPRYAIHIVAFAGIILLCLVLLDPEALKGSRALSGILPIIGLLAFAGQRLMPELQKIYSSFTIMTAGVAAHDRVHADLEVGSKLEINRSEIAPLGLRERLELNKISYSYPNSDRVGLSNLTVVIQAGERIGVVGASGAGKTTLADVILGLLTPQAGAVRVDGILITHNTLRAWQRTVGYVPQDIFLIDASLSENIALGLTDDEVDYTRIERAARVARLHDFVMSELPDTYATRIGERGIRLSGGQRQRIGIARAMYHDADLIVFDEATSALDNLTERDVIAAMRDLPGHKTILLIAHRLSTVKACDKIIIMEQGRIADVGTWDELVKRNDAFRAITEAA